METTDLLKKVRQIEIKTRGLSNNIFAGQYHSAFKGRGMAFSEVREYQFGDDIRDIDWNVTARFHKPFVKVFEEERELTVMLLVDVSGSLEHSTDEISEACESKRIQEMHRRVCQIRASEKTEVKYMQSWEERIMIKQEGIAEGRIEGEKALLKSLIEKKMAKKYSAEQISAMLEVDVSEVENIMKEIQNEKYL